MPDSSGFNPAPIHLLAYGTLLGSNFYNSFVGGPLAYRCLPRAQFGTLQQHSFPTYFAIQTFLPALLALTFPAPKSLLAPGGLPETSNGIAGVLAPVHRGSVLVPLATMLVTAALNLVWIGPVTTRAMKERRHQETRDGVARAEEKKTAAAEGQSPEMKKVNRKFLALHGASTLLNLAGLLAAVHYGVVLSKRL